MIKGTFPIKGFLYSFHSINILILSFLPLLFFHNGLTETQIGLILSIGPMASLIAEPLSGYLSDLWKTNKKVILAFLSGLVLSGMFLFQVHSFFFILSIYFVLIFFLSPVSALADSLSQKTANQMNISFGSIRLWGSAGFAITALIAGQWFARLGIEQLPRLFLFFSVLTIVLGLFLRDVSVSDNKVSNQDFITLLTNQKFVLFLVVVFFVTITQRCNDNFIGLHLKKLGASESVIGWAWFIGVMTEVVVFATGHFWFKLLDELTFIAIAAVLYTIRFFMIAQIQDPLAVLWVQPLHGLTFGIFFPAAFQYVTKIVKPEVQSTGHILMITVLFGMSGMVGSFLGGFVMKGYGGFTLYYLLSASSFVGLLAVLGYRRLYRG
jgi:MFS transporter, PPP family, 3-phenylpropionic acid transporter